MKRVTIVDPEAVPHEKRVTRLHLDGHYLLITDKPCVVTSIQRYRNGTHVITVKNCKEG